MRGLLSYFGALQLLLFGRDLYHLLKNGFKLHHRDSYNDGTQSRLFSGSFAYAASVDPDKVADGMNEVYYLNWIYLPRLKFNIPTGGSTKLAIVSDVDDSPLQSVPLPFAFNFLGVNQRVAYISSNGYVAFDTTNIPGCIGCYSAMQTNVLQLSMYNVTYFGIIAGFMTDLDPSNSTLSFISMTNKTLDSVIIHYHQLRLYGYPKINNTFHIQLNSDGSSKIYLEDVTVPSEYPSNVADYLSNATNSMMVGLRSYSSSFHRKYFQQSSAQISDQLTWFASTSRPGIYPNRNLVQSQSIMVTCPISILWCATPGTITIPGMKTELSQGRPYSGDHINITLTTLAPLSCLDEFQEFTCEFSFYLPDKAPSLFNISANASFVDSEARNQFSCLLFLNQSQLSSYNTSSNHWKITVMLMASIKGYNTDNGDGTFLFPGEVIETHRGVINILQDSLFMNLEILQTNSSNSSTHGCSVLDNYPDALSQDCGTCAICGVLSTNLSLPQWNSSMECIRNRFVCPSASVFDVPFIEQCGASCPALFTNQSTSVINPWSQYSNNLEPYSDITLDRSRRCCSYNDLDCNGVCNGPAKVVVANGVYVCCNKVDCSGVCNGKSYLDCEGICRCPKCAGSTSDCAGVCRGGAKVDACNVCSGGSTGLSPIDQVEYCSPKMSVSPPGPIIANISYDTGSDGRPNDNKRGFQTNTNIIKVYNPNPYEIFIFATIAGSTPFSAENRLVDPIVSISPNKSSSAVRVPARDSFSFSVTSSLQRLLAGEVDSWTVKTLVLSYNRPTEYPLVTNQTVTIPIHPAIVDCSKIASEDICRVSPMCILCNNENYSYRKRRLQTVTMTSTSTTAATGGTRILFNQMTNGAEDDNIAGSPVCVTGDSTTDCNFVFRNYPTTSNQFLVFLSISALPIAFILAVVLKLPRLRVL